MSLNQLTNPIEKGIDATLNSLTVNEGLVLVCNNGSQLLLTPEEPGLEGDILVRVGNSGNVEFKNPSQIIPVTPSPGIYLQISDANPLEGTNVISLMTNADFLGSLVFPPNSLSAGSYHFKASGSISAINGAIFIVRLVTNNNIILADSETVTTALNNNFFQVDCDFTIRSTGGAGDASILTSLVAKYSVTGTSQLNGRQVVNLEETNFSTLVQNTFDFKAGFNINNPSNVIQCRQCVLYKTF